MTIESFSGAACVAAPCCPSGATGFDPGCARACRAASPGSKRRSGSQSIRSLCWLCRGDYIRGRVRQIIFAPTFGANRRGLARCRPRERCLRFLNRQARCHCHLKRRYGQRARGRRTITPTGVPLEPAGTMTYHELFEIYTEQIAALAEAGADLLVVEDHARHRRDDRRPRGGAERLRPAGHCAA